MKNLIIPVNNEAHSRALVSVVGEETAQVVLKAYTAIDSAMKFGYERGTKEAAEALKVSEEDKSEREAQDSFLFSQGSSEGYKEGFSAADNSGHGQSAWDHGFNTGYDDGYIDGVSDARVSPAEADARVAELCHFDDEYFDCEDYDYTGPLEDAFDDTDPDYEDLKSTF